MFLSCSYIKNEKKEMYQDIKLYFSCLLICYTIACYFHADLDNPVTVRLRCCIGVHRKEMALNCSWNLPSGAWVRIRVSQSKSLTIPSLHSHFPTPNIWLWSSLRAEWGALEKNCLRIQTLCDVIQCRDVALNEMKGKVIVIQSLVKYFNTHQWYHLINYNCDIPVLIMWWFELL